VIAFFAWPDDPDYPESIKAAGAAGVFHIPSGFADCRAIIAEKLDLPLS
jgi:hypothetical protein